MRIQGLAAAGLRDGRLTKQLLARGRGCTLRTAGDVKFGQDVTDVGLDGRWANYQLCGDLGIV